MSNFADEVLDDIFGMDMPKPKKYEAPVEQIDPVPIAEKADIRSVQSQQRKAQKRRRSQASTMNFPNMNTPALQPSNYYRTLLGQ